MNAKLVKRVFRWTVAAAVVAVAALVIVGVVLRPDREERELPKPEACPVVSNALETIARVIARDGDFRRLDVRRFTCNDLYRELKGASPSATVWMPGENDWLVAGYRGGTTNSLAAVIDFFSEEADSPLSLPEMFASYVGTVAEVLPAFTGLDPEAEVLPELFVAREVPALRWLSTEDTEADIRRTVLSGIRSMQNYRRQVLGGNILSRKDDRKGATEAWAKAYRLSPNDTLLQERMHHLRRNAEVFVKVGKFGMAGNCYETLALINPRDYVALANLGICFKRIGRKDVSEAVLKRAEEVRNQELLGK